MRSIWLRLRPDEATRNPVHAALCESATLRREHVLWGTTADGVESLVSYVEGDRREYEAAVGALSTVREVDTTPDPDAGRGVGSGGTGASASAGTSTGPGPGPDTDTGAGAGTADGTGGFFVYLRADLSAADRRLGAALTRETVVWLPPVVFRADGTAEFTLVGHPDDLRGVVDDLSEGVTVVDLRVADHAVRFGRGLTDRQREALAVAWEAGYYEQPRGADLGTVADRLGVASGTASELLRRAERELVRDAVVDAGPGWTRLAR